MGKRNRKLNRVGVVSIGLLTFSAAIVMNLIAGARMVFAVGSDTDGNSSGSDSSSESNGWEIDLNAGSDEAEASSVTISLGAETSSVTLNAKNPSKLQGMIKKTANVTIGATDGYTIKVSGNPNLTSGGNTIQGVSGATTLNQMSNRWGWYYADGNANCSESASYKGMSSAGETVGSGELSSITTKTITMCFGAKIDASQPGGNYSNTVVISAVAQPKSITTFGGIKTMQEMTKEICAAANVNDTAYLQDTRDGKYYWVTKMLGSTPTAKDGECWMSQNLALDLSTSTALTSVTSDVSSSWTPGQSTSNKPTNGSNVADIWSWNLGDYVIIDPTATTACSASGNGLSACSGRFMPVGSRTASTNPNFYKDNGNKTYTATEYDAHYLAGNYYQWNAATAGTGGNITDANASGSICPKNWTLPSSGDNTTKGTFGRMLMRYGVENVPEGDSSVNSNTYNITLSPLFFIRGGWVGDNSDILDPFDYTGKLWYAGRYGDYWSSRISSNRYCILTFSDSNVYPSGSSSNYIGNSLRCFVPTT